LISIIDWLTSAMPLQTLAICACHFSMCSGSLSPFLLITVIVIFRSLFLRLIFIIGSFFDKSCWVGCFLVIQRWRSRRNEGLKRICLILIDRILGF